MVCYSETSVSYMRPLSDFHWFPELPTARVIFLLLVEWKARNSRLNVCIIQVKKQ